MRLFWIGIALLCSENNGIWRAFMGKGIPEAPEKQVSQ